MTLNHHEIGPILSAADVKVGQRYRFAYPYWGVDANGKLCDTRNLPQYESRRDAAVTVVRETTAAERDMEAFGVGFVITTPDGWVGVCHPSELKPLDDL